MSFHEIRFPTSISLGSEGGPERRTEIVTLGSGHEERNTRWADSRRKYNAGYGIKSLDDLHSVIDFFEERRGRLYGFRWKDHTDYKSCPPSQAISDTDQIIGTGDGATDTFQLIKTYGTVYAPYTRQITKPVGKTLTDLSFGPTSRWDLGNQFDVQLEDGQLTSLEDLSLFNGGNLAAVQNTNGQWEVIQFKNAELIAEKTYRLSTLLRGQGGTENYMENINPAGASFILLDDAITSVSLGINDIGLPYNWKYGPANRDIGHSSYSEEIHAFSGHSYKPLSPVHIETTFISNDLHISWKRRTRIGGDSWELSEVPLGEEIELYEIEIMDGENVIRLMSSTIQQVTYAEAEQLTDWGTIQSSYAIRIYQISATIGRGTPAIHTS
ncbi:MAG: phage distal tail protein, Rcc01695 family [Methyloligellaceae bacterium]